MSQPTGNGAFSGGGDRGHWRRHRPAPRGRIGARRGAYGMASVASTLPPIVSAPREARRLCGLSDAAVYLGISPWSVRELVWRESPRASRPSCLRRLLFDYRDLAAFVVALCPSVRKDAVGPRPEVFGE